MSTRRLVASAAISLVLGAGLGLVVVVVSAATAPRDRRPIGTMTSGPAVIRSVP